MLEEIGYNVIEAGSGGSALDRLGREQGDFVAAVIDFAMPGMNGADLAQRIAAINPALPILLITGYAGADALASIGELPVVIKPFLAEELANKLRGAIEKGAPFSPIAADSH